MEKKDFDNKVKQLLNDFEENYDPKSWDNFQEKLNFEDEIDSLIKDSMENHREPFNEEHWEILTEEIHRRKVRQIIKRSAEAVIILLLILTAQNFFQFKDGSIQASRDKVILAKLDIDIPQVLMDYRFDIIRDDIMSNDVPNNFETNKSISENSFFLNEEWIASSAYNSDKRESFIQSINSLRLIGVSNSDYAQSAKLMHEVEIGHERIMVSGLKEGAESIIQPLEIEKTEPTLNTKEAFAPIRYQENGLWISIVMGPDVNFINSPFDLGLLKNPIQSQSGALSLGATVSKDVGKFELMTGLIYSSKNYNPFRIREFVPSINQKYLETSLRSLEFEQIQMPLLVHYHSPRWYGLSIYGTAGLGINVITNTFYDIETQVRSFSGASSSAKGGQNLNLRDLPKGAFQSGSFGDNVYTSAIIGFGVEKRFKSRYAVNLLTSYQRSISKEINSIINRTQQLGITVGLKVNLK